MGLQSIHNASFNVSLQFQTQKYTDRVYFSEYPEELLIFGAVCSVVFAIFGISGNAISILALSQSKHIRNATTAFIVNLCVSDLLFCSFCMPLAARVFLRGKWFSNDATCKAFAFIRFSNPMVSMFTVLAITINRYILINFNNVYQLLYKKVPMTIMIGITWLFPILLLSLPLSGAWGQLGKHPRSGGCTIYRVNGKSPKMFIYVIGLLVPSVLFVICYVAIYATVKKVEGKTKKWNIKASLRWICSKKTGKFSNIDEENGRSREQLHDPVQDKNKFRLERMMLVIFIMFTVCYFPMFHLKVFRRGRNVPFLNVFAYVCYFFSTVINPIIYVVMSREYRKAYKALFAMD